MTHFDYTKLKNCWKLKITALLTYKGVNVADLKEPNWETILDEDTLLYRQDINQFAIDICEDIYGKATVNVSDFPDDVDWRYPANLLQDAPNDALNDYWDTFEEYVDNWEETTQFFCWLMDSLQYTPSDDDKNIGDAWRSLKTLLNGNSLGEIIDTNFDFNNKISQLLGTTIIPANWETQLVDKIDFDEVNIEKVALQVKADEYDRIHAKLSGRISDVELDNFLNAPPPCSHADYDIIKNERDTAQTDLVRITGERDTAISEKNTAIANLSAKELAIVEQIITDCELGTNTEKTLDKVIIRINELIKDNDTINPTVKDEIIKLSKELELGDNFQQQLSNITTYSNLIDIQKQAFNGKLSESKGEISKYQNRANWAIGLGSLSFGAALILAYLLLRKKQQNDKEELTED